METKKEGAHLTLPLINAAKTDYFAITRAISRTLFE